MKVTWQTDDYQEGGIWFSKKSMVLGQIGTGVTLDTNTLEMPSLTEERYDFDISSYSSRCSLGGYIRFMKRKC